MVSHRRRAGAGGGVFMCWGTGGAGVRWMNVFAFALEKENVEKMRKNKLIYMLKLANQADLS